MQERLLASTFCDGGLMLELPIFAFLLIVISDQEAISIFCSIFKLPILISFSISAQLLHLYCRDTYMGDFCDPGNLSKTSRDKEVPNARKSRMFHELRSDPHAFIHRARKSLWKISPQLQESLNRTSSEIVVWMQKGSPWRAFLVSSVGVVLLLGLAALGTFMLFFLAATLNAVAIAFLASVASVGAFAALFFTTLTTIYIGVLVMACLTISAVTFFCVCAAVTAAGWVAFLWVVWQGLKKGAGFGERALHGFWVHQRHPIE